MCCLWIMFVTAVCFSFLLKLNKNIYHRIFSKFPISTNFSDRLRKTIYPPDYTQELTKHLQKSPNVDREIFDFLKPERDICTKNTIPNQITSFMLTPPQAIYIWRPIWAWFQLYLTRNALQQKSNSFPGLFRYRD